MMIACSASDAVKWTVS